jgi:hypothetical protein
LGCGATVQGHSPGRHGNCGYKRFLTSSDCADAAPVSSTGASNNNTNTSFKCAPFACVVVQICAFSPVNLSASLSSVENTNDRILRMDSIVKYLAAAIDGRQASLYWPLSIA